MIFRALGVINSLESHDDKNMLIPTIKQIVNFKSKVQFKSTFLWPRIIIKAAHHNKSRVCIFTCFSLSDERVVKTPFGQIPFPFLRSTAYKFFAKPRSMFFFINNCGSRNYIPPSTVRPQLTVPATVNGGCSKLFKTAHFNSTLCSV